MGEDLGGKIEGKDQDFLEMKSCHHPIHEDSMEFSVYSLFSCRFTKFCIDFVIFMEMISLTPFWCLDLMSFGFIFDS